MMDVSRENDIVCHYKDNFGMQEYDLCIGKKLKKWNDSFEFFYDTNEGDIATDYLANDMSWFVVSERLRNILSDLNTDIQYFEVNIVEKNTNQSLSNYYVANILKLVNALCLEKSDYFGTEIEGIGTIYTVSKYAVFEEKVCGIDMFKLPDNQEISIFVSERFKSIVEENEITGMEFLEIHVE